MAVSRKWNMVFMMWIFSNWKPREASVKRGKAHRSIIFCPHGQAFVFEAQHIFGHSTSFWCVLQVLWAGVGHHCAACRLGGLHAEGVCWQLLVCLSAVLTPVPLSSSFTARLRHGRAWSLQRHHELGSFASVLKAGCFKG